MLFSVTWGILKFPERWRGDWVLHQPRGHLSVANPLAALTRWPEEISSRKKKHNSRGRRHTPQWLKREDEVEVASRALHMGPRENVFQNRTTRGKYTPTPISWSATPVRGSVDPDLEKRGVHRARAPGCSERKKKPAVEDTTMRLGTDGLSTWVLGRGRGFFLVSPTLAYIHPRNNGHRNDNTGETRTAQLFRVHRHMLVPWKGVARNYQHTHLDRI